MEKAVKNTIHLTPKVEKVKKINEKFKEPVKTSFDIKKRISHKVWAKTDVRQKWLQYMYKKSNYNKDLIYTFLAENPKMGITTKSGMVGANGWSDWGICQINAGWHKDILGGSDGKYFKDWFYNPYKQIDYCIKLYNGGTKFYGYKKRKKSINKVDFL